jgi:hypothetical protein
MAGKIMSPSFTSFLAWVILSLVTGLTAAGVWSAPAPASGGDAIWQRLLEEHVTEDGWVDYRGFQREREALNAYLTSLADASLDSLSGSHVLAFLINAYNAYTVASVLDFYPVRSVKDVPGFFTRRVHRVAGQKLSLDDIEKWARDFGDPRIHFALNCASRSCPKLLRFPYRGDSLDVHLDRATREFLTDPTRGMRIDRDKGIIYLSRLFKWYGGDFAKEGGRANVVELALGFLDASKGLNYVKRYLSAEDLDFVQNRRPKIVHMAYDWTLNEMPTSSPASGGTTH